MSPAAPSLQPGLQLILPQNISLSSAINSPTKYLEKLRLSLHVIKWFYHWKLEFEHLDLDIEAENI